MTPSVTVADQQSISRLDNDARVGASFIAPLLVVAAGFLARLIPAWRYFLNPDEALHYVLASQSSLVMAYKAALTSAHPPLLILVLYYWRWLGQSELILRLPSVLAGTAACWLIYRWLRLVTEQATALTGLLLFAFAPTLIWVSAEIRQYALLLFFISGCLYLSERAIQENSPAQMMWFSLSLYGALLTHYSSLLFAFVVGVYMLARLYPYKQNPRLFIAWAIGQAGALAIAGYFLLTHVRYLMASAMIREDAETYMRKSFFHAGENHVAGFIALQTLRFSTYLFSHGVVGTLSLVAFLAGIGLYLKGNGPRRSMGPSPRVLALLLGLPFVVECGAALLGVYPYGGARHCILLAPFAVAGMSLSLAKLAPTRVWTRSAVIATILAFCNFFPAPPPMIRPRNQTRTWMVEAVDVLRHSAPPGSIIVADYESGLLLGYYLCGHGIVQEFAPFQSFAKTDCGPYMVMTTPPDLGKFYADNLAGQMTKLAGTYSVAPGAKIWLFNAGWITDSTPALLAELRQYDCSEPQRFGENIFLCRLVIPADAGASREPSSQ